MANGRPSVPNPVKRILRQEAGFGCCICGLPIIEYHHIIDWADENHFRPEDMMVLCPTHHDMATKHALDRADQYKFKTNPHNKRIGRVSGNLYLKQDYPAIQFGSVIIISEKDMITINDKSIIKARIEGNSLLLSIRLYGKSGQHLCSVTDNEWESGDPFAWDIESDWRTLILRERQGLINLSLDMRDTPPSVQGEFWNGKSRLKISSRNFYLDGISVDLNISDLALVDFPLVLSDDSISIGGGSGAIMSGADKRERLRKAADAWRTLQRKQAS